MSASKLIRASLCTALIASMVVITAPGLANATGSEWHWLNPLPRGETLNDVDIAPGDPSVAYAVGNFGCIMKSYDGGVNWVLKTSGTDKDLNAISVVSPSVAWAAGDGGVILKTSDGASWTAQVSTTPDDIAGIFFRDQLRGWACTYSGVLLSTTDGGSTWVVNQTFPDVYFRSLCFTSDTVGYAVADGGIYKTTNAGASWVNTHTLGAGGQYATDIAFVPGNANVGWITCDNPSSSGNSAYRTQNAGATWDPIDIGTGYWYTVSIASDGTVWFGGNNSQPNRIARFADGPSPVPTIMSYTSNYGSAFPIMGIDCSSGTTALAVGGLGTTARTTDGGTNWTLRPTQLGTNLYDVQFLDLRTGYACGSDGRVWKSTNAGVTWTPTNLTAPATLYGLWFRDVNTGWAVGAGGRIYKTSDGGANWTPQDSTLSPSIELYEVLFVDSYKGWAVGMNGSVVSTTNGGVTWTATALGTNDLTSLDFYGTQDGVIVGNAGAVYVTSDGGAHWNPPTTPSPVTADLYAVDCVSTSAFFIGGMATNSPLIGSFTMLKTLDDGAGWSTVPAGPSPALTEFTFHGPVHDMQFVDANNGWVAFSDGFLAKTVNGGTDWTYARASDELFRSLSAVDMSAVWAVGSGGRIMSNYWYETTKVYRFYNVKNGTHFYTSSSEEKANVLKTWPDIFKYEGVGYEYDGLKATAPLYRFYNKVNGSHFYTASLEEANTVIAKWSNVYQYDGPAFPVSQTPVVGGGTVYRFYNVKTGSHFFTASADERDMVIATWPNIFKYEGEAYYLPM